MTAKVKFSFCMNSKAQVKQILALTYNNILMYISMCSIFLQISPHDIILSLIIVWRENVIRKF